MTENSEIKKDDEGCEHECKKCSMKMKKDGGPSSAESKLHESHDHDKKSVEVDVTKDTGPVTPNQPPAVVMPEDLARFAALLEAIKSKIHS